MYGLLQSLLGRKLLTPLLRPVTRLMVGAIAIPLFRFFLRRCVRLQDLDQELEKDLEQWFRGSLLLLAATANMEQVLFEWVPPRGDWLLMASRLLLAVGIIESMPDQELFSIIHPGPKKPKLRRGRILADCREQCGPFIKGLLCQHLNRSSPVFAIMAAIFNGPEGWVFYGIAITQYLIIGLVTSKDKALDALSQFDRQVAIRRRELIEEFEVDAPAGHREVSPISNLPPTGPTVATCGADAGSGAVNRAGSSSTAPASAAFAPSGMDEPSGIPSLENATLYSPVSSPEARSR